MNNTRAPDAGDTAPRPPADKRSRPDAAEAPPTSPAQDAPNYDERTDGGRAIPDGDLNSANDE